MTPPRRGHARVLPQAAHKETAHHPEVDGTGSQLAVQLAVQDRPESRCAMTATDYAQVRRYATMWNWEHGKTERIGTVWCHFYEPLRFVNEQPPADAKPYCCYLKTVVFYKDMSTLERYCETEHYGFMCVAPTLLFHDRIWWDVCSGSCEYVDGQWCMIWKARKNTDHAERANKGWCAQ